MTLTLPYETKIAGGNPALITHYFPSQERPYIGLYLDGPTLNASATFYPATWLPSGIYNDQRPSGMDLILPQEQEAA